MGGDPFLPVALALRFVLSLVLYGQHRMHLSVQAQLRIEPKLPFSAEDTNESSDSKPGPAAKGNPVTKELTELPLGAWPYSPVLALLWTAERPAPPSKTTSPLIPLPCGPRMLRAVLNLRLFPCGKREGQK